MASYRLLFDGMLAASHTTTTPWLLMNALLLPKPRNRRLRAAVAPLGLRRIEAALIDGGFDADDVIVVEPDRLDEAIGPETRLIGVSSGEPAGLGMNTSTMTGIAGGRIYPAASFERLMRQIRTVAAEKSPEAKVVLGGPGAWQIAGDEIRCREKGIHHIVTGYAEGNAAETFRAIIRGDAERVITGVAPHAEKIPAIRSASTMGAVEISRGCGLGCKFCTIRNVPMRHLPANTILADVETNLRNGIRDVALLSEDFFRYGSTGTGVNPPALIELLRELRRIDQLRLLQIDHANLLSVSRFDDSELRQVRELLAGNTGHEYLWVNLGVETASGSLLKQNGGTAKMGECPPDAWASFCEEQVRRLSGAGYFPMVSLMLCLPGETPEDIQATKAFIARPSDLSLCIFPMLYAPIDGSQAPSASDLSVQHWELIRACYACNFKWVPRMYWDNQAAAGVGLARRLLMQALGIGQMLQWKTLMAWRKRRAGKRLHPACCGAANEAIV